MKRRELIALLGSAAVWPIAARAQERAMPVIGFLSSKAPEADASLMVAFRQGLKESSYVDGQNVAIEYRGANGHYERLPALAGDLVNRRVAVMFASALPSVLAAKTASSTIPIVFVISADPAKLGVVNSLNRPGGNITGVSQYDGVLGAKRLELLRELVPNAGVVAIFSNPQNPHAEDHLADVEKAARTLGQQTEVFRVSSESEIDAAFAGLVSRRASAIFVTDDPLFGIQREQFVALAARHKLPAIYYSREFVAAGGLISYASNPSDNYRKAGVYVGRILKGDEPANLPILLPTKFELVINLKTARALGIGVPPVLLAAADEVIE